MDNNILSIGQDTIGFLSLKDERIAAAIKLIGPIAFRIHPNDESFFVETIIGQMLSNKVADTITRRLYALCDGRVSAEQIETLGFDGVRSIGISAQKTEYIMRFCHMMKSDPDYLLKLADLDDAAVLKALTALRGIGNWTAKMYLLFVLNRPSVIPYEDGAFLQAYRWLYKPRKIDPPAIERRCKRWHPYESIGARYLYRILDYGITKYTDIAEAQELWVLPHGKT